MKTCPNHMEAREVYTWPLHCYAGGQGKKTPIPPGSLILDLAGGLLPAVRTIGVIIPGWTQKYVRIEWPDMSVPNLNADDWSRVARAIAKEKTVYVSCIGGHGRTGTALAILGHFWGCLPKDMDPVDYLRKVYCSEAVETPGQAKYITAVTGRPCDSSTARYPKQPAAARTQGNYRVGSDGTVDIIRDAHKLEYKGSYFGDRGGSAADDYTGGKEDRSWTTGKKVDSSHASGLPCDKCGMAKQGEHFTWCERKG